jgi:hypothetical protein
VLFAARARASFDNRGQLQDAALATALRGVLDAFAQWVVLKGQEYESANSISI